MRDMKKKIRAGRNLTAHKKGYKSTISGGQSKSPGRRIEGGSDVFDTVLGIRDILVRIRIHGYLWLIDPDRIQVRLRLLSFSDFKDNLPEGIFSLFKN